MACAIIPVLWRWKQGDQELEANLGTQEACSNTEIAQCLLSSLMTWVWYLAFTQWKDKTVWLLQREHYVYSFTSVTLVQTRSVTLVSKGPRNTGGAQIHTQANTHTHKIIKKLKFLSFQVNTGSILVRELDDSKIRRGRRNRSHRPSSKLRREYK